MAQLFEQGRAANSAGRPAEAERLLRRALRRLEAGETVGEFPSADGHASRVAVARVRILLALSTALMERRGPGPAVAAVDEAITHVADSRLLAGMCHSQRGMVHGRSGRPAQALRELDLAVAALDVMTPRDRFVILLSRGMVRMDLADAAGAQADFAAAVELTVEHEMPRQEFMARHNLGCAVALAGDLPRALHLMLEADRVPTDISRAVAQLDRARVLIEAGLVSEGAALLAEALKVGRTRMQRMVAGEIELELARALVLLGEVSQAQQAARRARRSFGSDGPAWRRRTELVLLVAQVHSGVGLRAVAARAARLAEEFEADGDRMSWGEARLVEAEALARQGQWEPAQERLTETAQTHRSASLSSQLRHRRVAAMVATGRGNPAQARRELRAAARVLGTALASTGSIDLRAAISLHAEELARLDLSIALTRGPQEVLVALERWRAVSSAVPVVRPPADPELSRLVVALRSLRAELRENPTATERLEEQRRSLEREVATRSWTARGPATSASVGATGRTVAQVREQLRERDTDLVMYGHDGNRLGAVVLSRGRSRVHDLAPLGQVIEAQRRLGADLSTLGSVGESPMRQIVAASLERSLRAFADLVLTPLRLRDRLLVVPVDRMSALPWGLLPSRVGLPTTVAPSLASWLRGAHTVRSPRVSTLAGPGLPLAGLEADVVAGVWRAPGTSDGGSAGTDDGSAGTDGGSAGTDGGPPGTEQPGPSHAIATGADLQAALGSSDVLHVAAHGTHQPESPLLSSVWMADGPVFLCDLEQAERAASLVVVSACDAARSHGRGRGQHLGLASGLLALGVGSVVAAVCPVPDRTAAELMPRYHAHLREGADSSEALALAAAATEDPLAGAFLAMGSPWRVG